MEDTKILSREELKNAALIIKDGGTVVFPTETVYGLGANAFLEKAVEKIFIAKGRPQDNPLIIHISDINDIYNLTYDFNSSAQKLAEKFMPGPITLVVYKNDNIPDIVSAGLKTVGIRCPSNPIAKKFIEECGCPIAAPSANISGSVSATSFFDVKDELMGRVDAIIEGDNCDFGIESTVVDVTKESPVILRPGSITFEMIKEVIPDVKLHPSLVGERLENMKEKPASPGMKYKHYSPKAEVYMVYGEYEKILEWFLKKNNENKCLFMFSELIEDFKNKSSLDKNKKNVYDIGSEKNLNIMAQKIFSYLKKADYDGYKTIYIPAVEEKNIGFSVMNRLKKSCGGKVIKL